jgi:hypothetical protein
MNRSAPFFVATLFSKRNVRIVFSAIGETLVVAM